MPTRPSVAFTFASVSGSGMWIAGSALKPSKALSWPTTVSVPTRSASFSPAPMSPTVSGAAAPGAPGCRFCSRSRPWRRISICAWAASPVSKPTASAHAIMAVFVVISSLPCGTPSCHEAVGPVHRRGQLLPHDGKRFPARYGARLANFREMSRFQSVRTDAGNRGKRPGGQAAARWRMRSGRGRMGGAPGMSSRLPR